MIKSVIGVIGIEIDENYKWKDTIFIDDTVSSKDEEAYDKCLGFIKVIYKEKINYEDSRKIEEDIWGNEKYIYDSKKEAKIYFEKPNVCVIETRQEVNEWLVMMLQIMLLKNGYSFIHAAGVSKDNRAIVLPSWGGVGKTACVSKLVRAGYKLLGDDLNIITAEGKIYGFPKKFVLYFYHKNLFPEVFNKKAPKCNAVLNKFYSNIIPMVKRALRAFPAVLAFFRKHNPQSMKVSPAEIFGEESLEKQSEIKQAIWIERTKNKNNFNKLENIKLAQKALSVTINEIFNESISMIFIMCGLGIIEYKEVFGNMEKIYEKAFEKVISENLGVSTDKKVEVVADEVMKNIKI